MISGIIRKKDSEKICINVNCEQYNISESTIEVLEIPLDCINHLAIEHLKFETSIYFKGDGEILVLFLDLLSLQHDSNVLSKIKFNILIHKFFEKIIVQSGKNELTEEQVAELKEYIETHLHETLKIQDLAKIIEINQQYLKERFKNTYGVTVHEYIVNQRLEKAKYLIKDSHYSLQEIALKIGYSSLSSLSQAFKHKFRKPPLSFKISNN